MRPFRFRLERLGKVRRIQEELERERWLAAEAARRDAEAAEERARAASFAAENDLRERQSADAIRVSEVLQAQNALERARGLLRRARERARTAEYQAERLRVPWEERRKEVRGLERLEQQAREAWRREELQRESKELDEVAGQRARLVETASGRPFARPIRENARSAGASGAGAPADAQAALETVRSTESSRLDRS